jgi:hypothetical protein
MLKPVSTLKLNVDGSLGSGSLRKAFGGRLGSPRTNEGRDQAVSGGS